MANLYMVCGQPGSGKSYWAEHCNIPNLTVISRDKIRFSLLKENESYFNKEDEVYRIFWDTINSELEKGHNVLADQTSLNPKSRKYLLQNIKDYDKAIIIWVKTPLDIALERNETRKGTKTYVPRDMIRHMYSSFKEPEYKEGFYKIYKVEDDTLSEKLFNGEWKEVSFNDLVNQ